MAELSTISATSIYNQVYPLQKPDYSRDVTDASQKAFVLVHLTSSLGTNIESRLLTELWRDLACIFGDVKFCEIRADMCIEGYPERNTPAILVYKDGDIKKQVVTLRDLGGTQATIKGLAGLLVEVGAVKPNDHRLTKLRVSRPPTIIENHWYGRFKPVTNKTETRFPGLGVSNVKSHLLRIDL